ncbi:MAG: 7-carboxy-7-deazaguanine synthase QueE [Candidatus Methanoperedenaceae archaeon]|nr:7-carboxy-7-deazaguanine synthase QueE [Candidatus Methanoperedenaceae archaeon]
MQAQIEEVFNSIQGEGTHAGTRQVFVRFQQCQLHCAYCDTPRSRSISDSCSIERTSGKGDFQSVKNPVDRDILIGAIQKIWTPSTRHISLTGGEPLIHADFIRELNTEYPLYLETNSGFPGEARKLKDVIAFASCDIKLPEHDSTPHYDELLKNELETISIFNECAETFVKIVILPETTKGSLSEAVNGIASIDPGIPLILQPVTSKMHVKTQQLFELMDFAAEKLKDVRVIPQTHKMMGLI